MTQDAPSSMQNRPLLLLGGAGGAMLAGAVGLWVWYGTAVFFEVLRTGWAACF